jgi:predicted acyltransferase
MSESISVDEPQPDHSVTPKPRMASLDVFRGLTVAGMIFVNMVSLGALSKLNEKKEFVNAEALERLGWWKNSYLWIDHADWHSSWHLADFVFPFFLHIVGMSMAFSFSTYQREDLSNRQIIIVRLKRFALLFALGLFINGTVYAICKIPEIGIYNFSSVRIMGVLQRIALADFFAAMLILYFPLSKTKKLLGIAAGILIGYWLLLSFIPAPGTPSQILSSIDSKNFNIAAYIDRLIIPGNRLSETTYDAEGIISTIPAIISVLLGYFHSQWLKDNKPDKRKNSISMGICALGLIIMGILWGSFFPINKNLWTSSYVLFMAGWAVLIFTLLYELIDVQRIGKVESKLDKDKNPLIEAKGLARLWILPLSWMGVSPLIAFVGSVLMIKITKRNNINGCGEGATTIYEYLVKTTFGWSGWGHETVLFALTTVLFWFFLCYLIYQNRWFVKLSAAKSIETK